MHTTVRIAPSLAAGNLLRLEDEVRRLEQGGADAIHFDVMDGHFVPLLTIGVPFLEQVRKITSLHLDVHIMVSNPDAVFEHYLDAGADTLSISAESAQHPHRIFLKIRERGKRAGVAINPGTHWSAIEFLLPVLDQVTVMSVNPGFSRQAHLPEVHRKIVELAAFRAHHRLSFDIQVDGGVNTGNASTLRKLGADILVAGGAVFNHANLGEAIAALRYAARS